MRATVGAMGVGNSREMALQSGRERATRGEPADRGASRKEFAKKMIEIYYAELFSRFEERERQRLSLEYAVQVGVVSELSKRLRLQKQFVRELEYIRRRRKPMTVGDYEVISKIGQGSYGKVYLVRERKSGELFAMKKLNKKTMVSKRQVAHVWLERFVLSTVGECPYVVKMYYSFQDRQNLYFIMEYLPGGDLLGMLTRASFVSEDCARFYIAELVVAIDALHRTGIIHRDVKCDNIIFDARGHIRLSDFGLSKSLFHQSSLQDISSARSGYARTSTRHSVSNSRRFQANMAKMTVAQRAAAWKAMARREIFTAVGTPNYIAPEVLTNSAYTESCDWWSVGCILFEMLVGYPPFWSETPQMTIQMISKWRRYLIIPDLPESRLGRDAKDLIRRLLSDNAHRLGAKRGVEEFKEHSFFKDVQWDNLLNSKPPFVPELDSPSDTKYFDNLPISGSSIPPGQGSINRSLEEGQGLYDFPFSSVKNVRNVKKLKRLLSTDLDFAGFNYMPYYTGDLARADSENRSELSNMTSPERSRPLESPTKPIFNTPESPRAALARNRQTDTTKPPLLKTEEKAETIEGSPLELSDETSLESDRGEERTVLLTLPEGTKGAQDEKNAPCVEDFSEQLKELSSVTVTDVSDNEVETAVLAEQMEEAEIQVCADRARYLPEDMGDMENKFVKRASRSPLGKGRTRSLAERYSGTHDVKQASAVASPPTVGKALKEMDVEVPSTSEIDTFVNEAHAEISVAVAELDAPPADLDALVRNATSGLDSTAAELAATLEGIELEVGNGKVARDDGDPNPTASSRRARTFPSIIVP